MATELLHVGIDLGTSRSSISASNGERFVVDSFVGWPADMVAKKVLKRDVLIGHEAVANRTMLDLHRPLERGLLKEGSEKDVEAVRELLKHLLRLVGVSSNGKIDTKNVRAVVGVPAAALRTNKQYLRNSMKGIVDSLMIVSEPFAVAYRLNGPLHTMLVDIGAATTEDRVRANVIRSGGGGLTRGLAEAMEAALKQVGGGKVTYMADPVFIGSDGGLALALDAPDGDWEKLSA